MFTLSHSTVVTEPFDSYPNGDLTARGTVNVFINRTSSDNNPVKVNNISVNNQNGVSFFSHTELSVSALRAIADSLRRLADESEKANDEMLKLIK